MSSDETSVTTNVSTTGVLWRLESTEICFGRGSAPDTAGGAHDAPPDPLAGLGEGNPLPIPYLVVDSFGFSASAPRTLPTQLSSPAVPSGSAPGCKRCRRSHVSAEKPLRVPVLITPNTRVPA